MRWVQKNGVCDLYRNYGQLFDTAGQFRLPRDIVLAKTRTTVSLKFAGQLNVIGLNS